MAPTNDGRVPRPGEGLVPGARVKILRGRHAGQTATLRLESETQRGMWVADLGPCHHEDKLTGAKPGEHLMVYYHRSQLQVVG